MLKYQRFPGLYNKLRSITVEPVHFKNEPGVRFFAKNNDPAGQRVMAVTISIDHAVELAKEILAAHAPEELKPAEPPKPPTFSETPVGTFLHHPLWGVVRAISWDDFKDAADYSPDDDTLPVETPSGSQYAAAWVSSARNQWRILTDDEVEVTEAWKLKE